MERKFTGVFIPAHIWVMDITPTQKFLLGEISALDPANEGCYATNAHFAESLHCKPNTVSEHLAGLMRADLIEMSVVDGKRYIRRVGAAVQMAPNWGSEKPKGGFGKTDRI